MNAQEQNNTDYHLLGKYLAGEATPEEAMLVDEWLHVPGNRNQFEELEKIWNRLPGDVTHRLPDRLAAWRELQPLLTDTHQAPVKKLWLRWTVAASLLLAVGLLVFTMLPTRGQKFIVKGPSSIVMRDSLPDGSHVVLNRNAVLKYAEEFNTNNRLVQLQGECFFDVTHNRAKPFIIVIDNVNIKVMGTSFNVKQHADGIEVQVKTGLVKMYTENKEIAVAKGQKGIYWKHRDEFEIADGVDDNSVAYATREFSFSSLTVKQLIPYLEDAYGVKIVARNEKLLQCMMTGVFKGENVDQILEIIGVTLSLTYTKEGNTYYLNGDGCD